MPLDGPRQAAAIDELARAYPFLAEQIALPAWAADIPHAAMLRIGARDATEADGVLISVRPGAGARAARRSLHGLADNLLRAHAGDRGLRLGGSVLPARTLRRVLRGLNLFLIDERSDADRDAVWALDTFPRIRWHIVLGDDAGDGDATSVDPQPADDLAALIASGLVACPASGVAAPAVRRHANGGGRGSSVATFGITAGPCTSAKDLRATARTMSAGLIAFLRDAKATADGGVAALRTPGLQFDTSGRASGGSLPIVWDCAGDRDLTFRVVGPVADGFAAEQPKLVSSGGPGRRTARMNLRFVGRPGSHLSAALRIRCDQTREDWIVHLDAAPSSRLRLVAGGGSSAQAESGPVAARARA